MNEDIRQSISKVSHLHSEVAAFLAQKLSSRGLPELISSHGNILFQLSKEEKLTMTDLSRRIHRDKSTTTVLVKKLEKNGYVERTQCPEDNRITWIKLSAKGREYNSVTGAISKALTERCYNGFTEEEKKTVFSLLSRIEENFSE